MADSYVCSGARIKCSCGDKISTLTVFPNRTVFLTEKPMANISDHISINNIAPFGKCHTVSYPPTGSATSANHGCLTPMPCVPGTISEWINGKGDYIIKGKPALLKSSYCRCKWGGIITITVDGQTDTGNADLSQETVETEEQWKLEQEEQLTPEEILDGIQLALDAAGFVPGFGAIPDLLNASISALRGNWAEAGMSLLAAIPLIGDAAAGAKLANKGMKLVKNLNKARKVALAKEAKKFISKNVSKELLLKKGICKSEKEVEFFQKSLRKERKDFASKFYKKQGMTNKRDIMNHVNGIDLNYAVNVKKMPPPYKLVRFNEPGKELGGSYYGVSNRTEGVINTPRRYGIQPVVVRKGQNGITVVRKKKVIYKIADNAPQFEYLESIAKPLKAPLDNDWESAKNLQSDVKNSKTGKYRRNWTDTKGGAMQAYIAPKNHKYIKFIK